MTNPYFYIVDVFAEEKLAGNQLAVFRNTHDLTDIQMQDIAREMNFSETTFILSEEPHNNGFDVRIFTPKLELPFAGHPTLGTAFIIHSEILGSKSETVNLNLKAGQIPVKLDISGGKNLCCMRQNPPTFGLIYEKEKFAELLNLDIEDILDEFPIQEVSTGFYTFIVPLRSLDAVRKARVNTQILYDLIKSTQAAPVLVFARETYNNKNDLNVRFFADALGIPEDPATGSANGCLAAYLVKHKYFGSSAIDIRVEQGIEIDRPSLLLLKAEEKEGNIEVNVGGNVILIAKGELV
ncbi:PhzF family phenazine biosynthesis protein [candidate division KSB1 bacterium]